MNFFEEQVADVGLEVEALIVGAVMQRGATAYDKVASILKAQDFSSIHNATMWTAMEKLIIAGQPCDLVCVIEKIGESQAFDLDYAIQVSKTHCSPSSIARYAEMVAKAAKERRARATIAKAGDDIKDTEKTLEQRVGGVIADLESIISERTNSAPVSISELAIGLIDNVMAVAEGRAIGGRPTHIPSLDKKLSGGTRDGKLIIVAARPSVGKSSIAMQLLINQAEDGVPGAFFGMEMENSEVTMRAVATLGRAPFGGMMSGQMSDSEWSRMSEGVEKVQHLPLFLFDKSGMTLSEVVSHARQLVRRHGIKNLVVDYLQLMVGTDGKKERRVQLEEITRGLKVLAKDLGLTVYLLSQLNREVEKRTDPRPQMSDLKECGAIEEDADTIMFLWDHKVHDDENFTKGMKLGKNRGGQKGEIALHFNGPTQSWTESTESLIAPQEKQSKPSRGMN